MKKLSIQESPKKGQENVWYEDTLWNVVSIIHPTEHETYILIQRFDRNTAYEDGSAPTEMLLIDCDNSKFLFDSPSETTVDEVGISECSVMNT